MVISTVSGSALLALELAWSKAATDEEALLQVTKRITKYAYWPRRRWWVIGGSAMFTGVLAYTLWEYRAYSAAATILWSVPIATVAMMALLGLFRTQGIWYRDRAFPINWRHRSPTIYTATPGDFPSTEGRRLTLASFVFNATSLTHGTCVSFDGQALPANGAVREFAEASAAFPGAFLPRRLPERAELFADGGIYDNTGVTYFRGTSTSPKNVIAVDAGVSSPAPKRLPYSFLTALTTKIPGVLATLAGAGAAGAFIGGFLQVGWLPMALFWGLIITVLGLLVLAPLAVLEGAWSDIRWLGRGWPTTLRAASNLHLCNFETAHAARGGRLVVVGLDDAVVALRAKTQLWTLPGDVAEQIVSEGYDRMTERLDELWDLDGHPVEPCKESAS